MHCNISRLLEEMLKLQCGRGQVDRRVNGSPVLVNDLGEDVAVRLICITKSKAFVNKKQAFVTFP